MDKERKLKAVADYVTFYDEKLKIIPTEEVISAYKNNVTSDILENVWYIFVRLPSYNAVKKGLTMLYRDCDGDFGYPTDIMESGYDENARYLYLERVLGKESEMTGWINMDQVIQRLQEEKRLIEGNWKVYKTD